MCSSSALPRSRRYCSPGSLNRDPDGCCPEYRSGSTSPSRLQLAPTPLAGPQPFLLPFRLLKDRQVVVGLRPNREETLVRCAARAQVAGHGTSASEAQMRERPHHTAGIDAAVRDDRFELRRGFMTLARLQKREPAKVSGSKRPHVEAVRTRGLQELDRPSSVSSRQLHQRAPC